MAWTILPLVTKILLIDFADINGRIKALVKYEFRATIRDADRRGLFAPGAPRAGLHRRLPWWRDE
jgi:hypothetical protein